MWKLIWKYFSFPPAFFFFFNLWNSLLLGTVTEELNLTGEDSTQVNICSCTSRDKVKYLRSEPFYFKTLTNLKCLGFGRGVLYGNVTVWLSMRIWSTCCWCLSGTRYGNNGLIAWFSPSINFLCRNYYPVKHRAKSCYFSFVLGIISIFLGEK